MGTFCWRKSHFCDIGCSNMTRIHRRLRRKCRPRSLQNKIHKIVHKLLFKKTCCALAIYAEATAKVAGNSILTMAFVLTVKSPESGIASCKCKSNKWSVSLISFSVVFTTSKLLKALSMFSFNFELIIVQFMIKHLCAPSIIPSNFDRNSV